MGWRIHPILDLMCILLLTPPLKFFQHAQEEVEAVAAGSVGISVFHPRLQEDTLGCRINRKTQAIHIIFLHCWYGHKLSIVTDNMCVFTSDISTWGGIQCSLGVECFHPKKQCELVLIHVCFSFFSMLLVGFFKCYEHIT